MQRFETLCCLISQVLGLQVAITYLAYEQGPRFRGPSLFDFLQMDGFAVGHFNSVFHAFTDGGVRVYRVQDLMISSF